MAPQPATLQNLADYMVSGYWTQGGGIPHHFGTAAAPVITYNVNGLTAPGQALAKAALQAWANVANITFKQVTGGGQIVFDDNQSGAFASAGYGPDGVTTSAFVNVGTGWLTTYGTAQGGYGYQTYIHEIGHALGLGHTGPYNGSGDYATQALFDNDTWQNSIMSYFGQGANGAAASYGFLLSPMAADIMAIQQIYGKATGGATAGNNVYAQNMSSKGMTIWDLAGIDTINFAADTRSQVVSLVGGASSNVWGGLSNLTIMSDTVIENFNAGTGSDRVTGNGANNILNLGAGNDWADGGAGNDTLLGGLGDDTLLGGAGNDWLEGGAGADRMEGGAGDDTYLVDSHLDVIVDTDGIDSVLSGASFVLSAGLENLTLTGTLAVNGTGNTSANVLTGNAGINSLSGDAGDDTLLGLAGNDVLQGGDGNDTLDGGVGVDAMTGGAGDDTYKVDSLLDTVVEAAGGGIDTVVSTVAFTLSEHLEHLTIAGAAAAAGTGNAYANVLTGNAAANKLTGLGGDDILRGGAGADILLGDDGNDLLDGGLGVDNMTGGAGDDVYILDAAGEKMIELAGGGFDVAFSSATTILSAFVENLTLTGLLNINGTGNAEANVIIGNAGNNILAGAAGDDVIEGGLGNDTLDGGLGNDSLTGGAGNDTYVVDGPGDVIVELLDGGLDTVLSGASFTLTDVLERLTLTGTAAINGTGTEAENILTGNAGINTLNALGGNDTLLGLGGNDTLLGGDGNDLLDGGAGADRMEGGAGDDIYKVDAITDVAIEAAGGGHDSVQSTVGFVLGTDVEDLTLLGIAGVKAVGNDGNNVLTGNAGANLMVGFLGDDRLLGLAGSDILDAGGGDDYLDGGLSNDILDGGAGADTLIGGLGDDSLRGGADADVFIFTAGKDVISDFQLGVDELRIASSFWGAHATASSLLAQHATMAVNGVILTFGTTTTISLAGVTDLAALANDILMG